MKKTYKVAGHYFDLTMPDDHEIWPLLTNYAPFESEEGDSVFSLEVVDQLPDGEQTLLLMDKSDEDMPRIELYNIGEDWLFEVSMFRDAPICMRLFATKDFRHAQMQVLSNSYGRFPVDNALMLLYAFATIDKHTLEMHASVTVRDDRAYLFLGRSGTGKSTHSRMWMETFSDAWLLNDDNPILRIIDGQLFVFGSPWSGKTPCYKNDERPVGAIVQLVQAPENSIQQMSLPESYASIYSSCSGLKVNRRMADCIYDTIANLLNTTPCYCLQCLPDHEAAHVCYEQVSRR